MELRQMPTEKIIVKEIPIPTEKAMLVKLLMSLSERYELKGSTISVGLREVRAIFRFPEHDLPKLRAIAENWADRDYITAKDLLKLERLECVMSPRFLRTGHHPKTTWQIPPQRSTTVYDDLNVTGLPEASLVDFPNSGSSLRVSLLKTGPSLQAR